MSDSLSEWSDGNRAELKITIGANSRPDGDGYIAYCFGNGLGAGAAINGAYCLIIDVAVSGDDDDIFSKNGANVPVIKYTSSHSFADEILFDAEMIDGKYDIVFSDEIAS